MLHKLKIKKKYADAISGGAKTFELRKEDDRRFNIGDIVIFEVEDSDYYNGIEGRAFFIPYVLRHSDFPDVIKKGHCVFALKQLSDDLSYYYTHDMVEQGANLEESI